MNSLKRLTLKGFKSIESLVDFELRPINVLIGANGAGKSNLIDVFVQADSWAGTKVSKAASRFQGCGPDRIASPPPGMPAFPAVD